MKNNIIFICTFFIFWLIFFPTTAIISNYTYDGWLKNLMIITMLFILRNDFKLIFNKEFKWFNISIIIFCITSIFSIIINEDTIGKYVTTRIKDGVITTYYGITSSKATIYYSLSLLVFSLFIEKLSHVNKVHIFLRYLWILSLITLLIIDYDAFSHVVINDSIGGYIVGTKFQVCYYNIYMCTLYYMLHPSLKKNKEKIIIIILILVTLAVSIHTKCTTVVFAIYVYSFLVFFIPKKYRKKISSGRFILLAIIIIGLGFFFFTTWLLEFNFVQNFIVNVLNEDITLTGRLGIYQNILDAFEKNLWFGYGNGNSRIISLYYTNVENPQNGLIEVFLNIGIIGCISFLMVIYNSVKHVSKYDWYKYPIIVYILTMIVISTVEVPYDKTFIFFNILLLANQFKLREDYSELIKWQSL